MEIRAEFALSCENNRIKTNKKLSILLNELKEYKQKDEWIGDAIYSIDQNGDLYKQVIEFCNNYKKDIRLIKLGYSVQVTDEDRERAVAFYPRLPVYYCEEDWERVYEYDECDFCYCKRRTDECFYVQIKGYIKNHQNDYGMAGIDRAGGGILLLPELVKKMIQEGIHEKYFQPVYSRGKKLMGYTYITDNILPEGALIDMNYKYLGKCPVCGGVKLKEVEEQYKFQPKKIKKEMLKHIRDVNFTYEFYDEYREIVVSKRVEQIIRKYVEYAEFIPIFMSE